MNSQSKSKMLTYSEWENLFKRNLRRYVRRKCHDFMYALFLFLLLVVPFFVLLGHYFLIGY
mgnify:CR=1 FL=1